MNAPVLLGLRPLGLGDFCTAVPAWRALRRQHPDHTIILAAGRWQLPLVALCPAIDALVDAEPLAQLPDGLIGVDLAVNLHGHGPRSTEVLRGLTPVRLVTFTTDRIDESGHAIPWDEDEHEVERWCRLVASAGAEADPTELDLLPPREPTALPDSTVVHVGASSGARRWPPDRWARTVHRLIADGHRIVLTGNRAERPLVAAVADEVGPDRIVDLAGRTSIEDLTALVADSRLVLSADTGIAHLATAYRRPSVVLFGPTPPALWGPPSNGPHRAIWTGRSGDPHAGNVDPGLLEIEPVDVLTAVDELLATPGPTHVTSTPPTDPPTFRTVGANPNPKGVLDV